MKKREVQYVEKIVEVLPSSPHFCGELLTKRQTLSTVVHAEQRVPSNLAKLAMLLEAQTWVPVSMEPVLPSKTN